MHYRAYCLDRNGHIAAAEDIDCKSDEHAMRVARVFHHEHGVEVWQGRRRVGAVPPPGFFASV